MPVSGSSPQGPKGARSSAAMLRSLALVVVLFVPVAFFAGWFDKLAAPAEKASSRAVPRSTGTLDGAIQHVKALPAKGDGVALAAQSTQEGHWRFVNRTGETFTAGTPDEMKRAVSLLHPEAKAGVRLSLYVTAETIAGNRAALKALPAGTELFVVAGSESYRVVRRGDGATERFYAEVRPNLVIEMSDQRLFDEAAWQLARPLDKAGIRVLALEPGGPSTLSAWPRTDKTSRRALIDVIDPASLPAAMGSVRGQTLLITGRVEREIVYVQPSSGPERSLLLKDLFQTAEDADVNLLVLHAPSTPRQPGGRNWLWLTVEVTGLDAAMQRARMADFMNSLGAAGRPLAVVAAPEGRRAVINLAVAGELTSGIGITRPVSDLFSGIVSDLTGKVVTTAVYANLRSANRQQELDQRLIPGIPSSLQLVYLGLAMLALLGVPVSRTWWQHIWPPEVADEYAGKAGFWLARSIRAAAYALIFLPLTAVIAAPYNLFSQIADGVMTPVRWWRRITGRKAAPRKPDTVAREAGPDRGSRPRPGPDPRDWQAVEAARRLGNTRPSR